MSPVFNKNNSHKPLLPNLSRHVLIHTCTEPSCNLLLHYIIVISRTQKPWISTFILASLLHINRSSTKRVTNRRWSYNHRTVVYAIYKHYRIFSTIVCPGILRTTTVQYAIDYKQSQKNGGIKSELVFIKNIRLYMI